MHIYKITKGNFALENTREKIRVPMKIIYDYANEYDYEYAIDNIIYDNCTMCYR